MQMNDSIGIDLLNRSKSYFCALTFKVFRSSLFVNVLHPFLEVDKNLSSTFETQKH